MRNAMLLCPALLLAAPAGADPAGAGPALTVPVTAPAGSGPMRLSLTAEVLAASRSPDLADVRLLDATGRRLPMARLVARGAAGEIRHPLTALPVLGRAGTLDDARLTLRLDPETGLRVAELEGALATDSRPTTLALLFDTRTIDGPAARLELSGEIPASQPVRMLVEASDDLRTWRKVGDQTLFQPAAGGRLDPVQLDGSGVKGRYLRLRWLSDTPLTARPRIDAATLVTTTGTPPQLVGARVPAAAVGSGRAFALALETATPVAALAIRPVDGGLVVPVTVLGRADAAGTWQRLGAGTAMLIGAEDGTVDDGEPIALAGGPTAQLRVEAAEASEGFARPPEVRAMFAPVPLLFVASGKAPYRLTVGEVKASPAWLPYATLAPTLGGRGLDTLPTARLPDRPATVAAAAIGEGMPRRTVWLWGVLLLATLSLAGMAWKLMRG